jgi:hypothetical protein
MYQAYRNMYEALGVKNIDNILKVPQRPMPMDPAVEHIQALGGQPFQAFKGQDHQAHITAHLNFMATNMAKNNPAVMASLQKNIFEHISLMALEQVEIEFQNEIMQLQQMQQNPQMMRDQMAQQQVMDLNMTIEARKAILIAEMMEEFMREEKKLLGDYGNDPLAKLRARELDIRSQENARKKDESDRRFDLDKMRAMMNQQNTDEKLDQNEELAKLRANTSIEKTILSKTLPNADQMMPNIDIIRKEN